MCCDGACHWPGAGHTWHTWGHVSGVCSHVSCHKQQGSEAGGGGTINWSGLIHSVPWDLLPIIINNINYCFSVKINQNLLRFVHIEYHENKRSTMQSHFMLAEALLLVVRYWLCIFITSLVSMMWSSLNQVWISAPRTAAASYFTYCVLIITIPSPCSGSAGPVSISVSGAAVDIVTMAQSVFYLQ